MNVKLLPNCRRTEKRSFHRVVPIRPVGGVPPGRPIGGFHGVPGPGALAPGPAQGLLLAAPVRHRHQRVPHEARLVCDCSPLSFSIGLFIFFGGINEGFPEGANYNDYFIFKAVL